MARGDRRLALSARDLRLCVKRWVCRERATAFRTWRRFLEIQRRLERCLRRFLNRHLAMALTKWTSHCRFAKRALKNQAIAFDMMERCIGRLLHRSMGEAFDAWLSNAEALSAADALQEQSTYSLEKCLRKWLQRLTSRAFRTWTAESQRILHRKRAMLRASRRCVLLWVRGEVAKAFRRWSGRASRLMICADASMRIERIMMRALRRLVATARARAFAAFREVATRSRALDHLATTRRLALEKCLRRWTKRSLARGLETWSTTTTFFHNLRRCVLRMLRRRLATSFSTWSGESFRLRRRETALVDAANGMRRCLTLWLRRKRARAFAMERPLLSVKIAERLHQTIGPRETEVSSTNTPRDTPESPEHVDPWKGPLPLPRRTFHQSNLCPTKGTKKMAAPREGESVGGLVPDRILHARHGASGGADCTQVSSKSLGHVDR